MLDGHSVLLIEADPPTRHYLERRLARLGAGVFTAADCTGALRQMYRVQPDIIVVDTTVAGPADQPLWRWLRQLTTGPLLLLAPPEHALPAEIPNAEGTHWLRKPLRPGDLSGCLESLQKRRERPGFPAPAARFRDDRLVIDLERGLVVVDGRPVSLSETEFRLLAYLVHNQGLTLSPETILQRVWPYRNRQRRARLHTYISRLRRKLEADPGQPRYLVTSAGEGYIFAPGARPAQAVNGGR